MIIGGHHYKVKLVDEMKVEGGIVLGMHNTKECVINIDKEQTLSRKKETLIHETIHAILTNAGFAEQDEHYIDTLANGLFQLGVGDLLWEKRGDK
jgi:hypothetical protein|tara:strand:+ start:603 stop:887 length:285 start_codon:yes stop_codon:yes gene_type:complete